MTTLPLPTPRKTLSLKSPSLLKVTGAPAEVAALLMPLPRHAAAGTIRSRKAQTRTVVIGPRGAHPDRRPDGHVQRPTGPWTSGRPGAQRVPATAQVCDDRFAALLDQVRARYPQAFPARSCVPLAEGIHRDMAECLGTSVRQARLFLADYCKSTEYLRVLARGGIRVDLHGVITGEITAFQVQIAREALKARGKGRRSASSPGS